MIVEYPGRAERVACAKRTREELIEYRPRRPLAVREDIRVRWMLARCERCQACPLVVRALTIMAPAKPEPASAQVFKLAS